MSAVADQRAPPGRSSPGKLDHDQPAPRFTAANRLSPTQDRNTLERTATPGRRTEEIATLISYPEEYSISSEVSHHHPHGHTSDAPRRDSPCSSVERKRSSSVEGSPRSTQSRKKRRTSPPPGHTDPSRIFGNGMGSDQGQFYTEGSSSTMDSQQPNYTTDAQGWSHHQRGESINSDTQLAEALQRVTSADVSPDHGYSTSSPHPSQQPHIAGGHTQTTSTMTAPMMQKQRKRNFSNRTKTGCLTCRERKKKCDETKPTCNNCERGGFYCKGYSPANGVFKATTPRDQPPLQAKNDYYDPTISSPYISQRHVPTTQPYGLPPPQERPGDAGRMRALPVEDERSHSRLNPPSQDVAQKAGYVRHEWRPPQPGQNNPESIPRQEYSQVSQLVDLPRQHPNFPHPGTPILLHPPHHRTTSQTSQYTDQRITAQLALEHASNRPSSGHSGSMYRAEKDFSTEKDKMLHGAPFRRNDSQLKKDRQDCAFAIYRFNKNVIEPGNLSDSARREQFRKIIEPHIKPSSETVDMHQSTMSPASSVSGKSMNGGGGNLSTELTAFGRLGSNVEVEAPFYCDYGYNIRIGDSVEIGANCRIQDACPVEIGARTVIGPDVKILAVDADFEGALAAPGEKRLLRGRRVVIGDDCYIGAGAIIAPGVTLDNGSVIAAGLLVQKNSTVGAVPANVMNKLPNQQHWSSTQY